MLDYCKSCNGIWLDAKEIVKVEDLSRKIEPLSKVSNTIKNLQDMGFQVLGAKASKE